MVQRTYGEMEIAEKLRGYKHAEPKRKTHHGSGIAKMYPGDKGDNYANVPRKEKSEWYSRYRAADIRIVGSMYLRELSISGRLRVRRWVACRVR